MIVLQIEAARHLNFGKVIVAPQRFSGSELRVLQLLRTHGSLSWVDIARTANVTKATASRIISD
jgi:DNA-binding MarR family transcriptional regulator